MGREKKWTITIDGQEHNVRAFQEGSRYSPANVSVDGDQDRVYWPRGGYVDEVLQIGGKDCRFVIRNYLPDLVVDGKFVDSKKPYEPIYDVPQKARTLVVICFVFVFILCIQKAWYSTILGFLMWLISDRVAHIPGFSPKKKLILYCAVPIGITILAILLRMFAY